MQHAFRVAQNTDWAGERYVREVFSNHLERVASFAQLGDHRLWDPATDGGWLHAAIDARCRNSRLDSHPVIDDIADDLGDRVDDASPSHRAEREQELVTGNTSVGVMLASGRLPGAIELARPGSGSNQNIPLFIKIPVPGATTRDPQAESSVCVNVTALPQRSTTQMCVVEPAP